MREKTRAFHRLADNVLPEVKQKRYLEMVDTFRVLADELNNSKLGQVHLVLVDQVSKRSVLDLSGRNDNNTLVVFERTELPTVRHASDLLQTNRGDGSKSMPQVGDYVACRLVKATSQSSRGVPLFKCNLLTFDSLKREINLNGFDYQRLNSVDKDQIFVN
jgi:tRNA A37 methylthiotransferase MiaB